MAEGISLSEGINTLSEGATGAVGEVASGAVAFGLAMKTPEILNDVSKNLSENVTRNLDEYFQE